MSVDPLVITWACHSKLVLPVPLTIHWCLRISRDHGHAVASSGQHAPNHSPGGCRLTKPTFS